jgi:methionyl-tRNA formyltransferase
MGSPAFAVPTLDALVGAGHEIAAVYSQPPRPAQRGKKLLPRWRGAAPIHRAILAGDEETGVTIMQMEAGLDTGPMLRVGRTPVARKTVGELTEELALIGARLMVEELANPSPPIVQPHDGVTHAPKIAKAEARIDWSTAAAFIERQVRAFAPAPGAWFEANGERVKLLAAELAEGPSAPPGTILDEQLTVACGTGAIRPTRLQRAGGRSMSTAELLRGFALVSGTVLP